jgi:hypothetical protein
LTVILFAAVLGSCVNVYAEIVIGKNGSGTITLEYAMSEELPALGRQDGNSRWPPLPVGTADFERTAARVEGLRFRSGDTKSRNGETVSRVRLDFDRLSALTDFLDGLGGAVDGGNDGAYRLSLPLIDRAPDHGEPAAANGELAAFVRDLSRGRALELRFRLPAAGELSLTDGTGAPLEVPAGWTVSGGNQAHFKAPLGDLLLREGELNLVLRWQVE